MFCLKFQATLEECIVNWVTSTLFYNPCLLLGITTSQECDSVLINGTGVIKSEGHPGSYPPFYECEWTIEVNINNFERIT